MDSNRNLTRYKFLLFTYILCSTLFTISLFLSAFFPANYHNNSTASYEDIPKTINGVKLNTDKLYKPQVQKVVFMVIDALRWDFVRDAEHTGSMPSTVSALRNNSACLIQTRVNAPTVTMPRIKAMTTGTVSSFLDVALNFGKTSVTSDSVLNQAWRHGHKLIFYGDDTWLKLFPDVFHRHEGTTSFFVSDYTEVDDNVTRHLDRELHEHEDWSIMILHYLGLDHIGHAFGPQSPLVKPKLQEMDRIIEQILRRVRRWNEDGIPALLIVCGDHGMKNSGGHGGATPEETLVPFVVFGRGCGSDESQIEQVDIATIMSVLLGVPIPQGNLGSISLEIIRDLPDSNKLFLLHYNAKQMFGHFRKLSEFESSEIYDNYYKTIKLHTEWLIGKSKVNHERQLSYIIDLYDKVLRGMKEILIKSAVKYDRTVMTIAIVLMLQIFLINLNKDWSNFFSPRLFLGWWTVGVGLWLLINHTLYNESNEVYFEIKDPPVITAVFIFFTINCYLCTKTSNLISTSVSLEFSKLIFPLAFVLHVASLGSSSFVEEEHQTWYFFWSTLLVYLFYSQIEKAYGSHQHSLNRDTVIKIVKVLFLLLIHRVLRKLNSTGNKYAHLPDIGGWLRGHESNVAMSLTVLISLLLLLLIGFVCEDSKYRRVNLGFHTVLAVCVYLRHTAENSVASLIAFSSHSRGIYEVRAFWIVLLVFLVYSFRRSFRIYRYERHKFLQRVVLDVVEVWVMLSVLLHRPHNIILVPMELVTILLVSDLTKNSRSDGNLIYISYFLGNIFYFYQGNSNSLATVDVAAGYVGLQSYWLTIAAMYLCINTYSAPVLSYLVLVYYSVRKENNFVRENIFSINRRYGIVRIFPVAIYTIIVTIQRYHLFIWTVFSPKLLYEAMYTAVLFVVMFVMQLPFLLTD